MAANGSPRASRFNDLLGLGLLLTLVATPIVWSFGYSLLYSLGVLGRLSSGFTLRHWSAALTTGGLWQSVLYSGLIAGVSTLLATIGALSIILLWPAARHSRTFLATLCLPLATPAAVMAFLTFQILNPGGVISRLAARVGLTQTAADFPVLVNDTWSIGLIVAQSCLSLPLLLLFVGKSWHAARVDRYCRLAESLGATTGQALWRVALPMLWSRLRPLCVLTFLTSLGAYELPLVLGRQTPQMFSVLTQRRFGMFDLEQRPQAFALAVVYLLIVATGAALLAKTQRRPA